MTSKLVTKLWAAVRLAQPQREPRDGWFQLFPDIDGHGRPETVLELLNSPRFVIPFLQHEGGSVLLLVRENVDWVAIGTGVKSSLVLPPDHQGAFQQRVAIRFTDDQKIEATIRWGDFIAEARLSDFLASSGTFIAAEAGFGTLMVNKRRVREFHIVNTTDAAHSPAE